MAWRNLDGLDELGENVFDDKNIFMTIACHFQLGEINGNDLERPAGQQMP